MPRRTTDGESAMATCRGPRRSPVEIGRSATIRCSDSATAGARFELGTRPRRRAALTNRTHCLTTGGLCGRIVLDLRRPMPRQSQPVRGGWLTASPHADFAHIGGRPNDTKADLVIRREPFPGPAAKGLARAIT